MTRYPFAFELSSHPGIHVEPLNDRHRNLIESEITPDHDESESPVDSHPQDTDTGDAPPSAEDDAP